MEQSTQINIAALKAAACCAGMDDTRYYLKGVFLIAKPRATYYVATNGHTLLAHFEGLAENSESNTLLGEWIIPNDLIAKLKAAPLDGTLQPGPDGRLLITDGKGIEHIAKPIDGTFPDWRRVLPSACEADKPVERAQFNPVLLAQFAKAAKALDYDPMGINIHTRGVSDSAAVTFGNRAETFGVIMPMRATADLWAGIPEWVAGA